MILEVTLFGLLVATLTSALSAFFLAVALGSVAFISVTILSALTAPKERSFYALLGGAAAVLALSLSLAGLRAGGVLSTILVGAAFSSAVGAVTACLALAARRSAVSLRAARAARAAALEAAHLDRAKLLEEGKTRFLSGDDLRAEVAEAEASLDRLRTALQSLEDVRLDLTEKLAAGAAAPDAAAPPISNDYARLRDEVDVKINLGRRILAAAELAAFHLACFEPIRRLLRRRPQEATLGLSRAATASELEERIGRAGEDIKGFVGEIEDARAALAALEARRPPPLSSAPLTAPPALALLDPDAPAAPPEANAAAPAPPDPLGRARSEIDAIESAYRAVLERMHVVRLRLATRAGMEQVASAAGAVSESARTMGLDESDLGLLLQEVARAESAMTISTPDGADVRALTDALARSADALDRNDAASLDELLKAMREMD
jgi:hypothetical protein